MKKALLLCLTLSGCALWGGIELSDLKGLTIKDVQKSYGEPVIVRHEGNQQMWVYKKKACSILIFFDDTQTVQFAESRGECR